MSFCHEHSLVPEGLSLPALSLDYLLRTACWKKNDLLLTTLPISWLKTGQIRVSQQCEGMQQKLCWLTHTV